MYVIACGPPPGNLSIYGIYLRRVPGSGKVRSGTLLKAVHSAQGARPSLMISRSVRSVYFKSRKAQRLV